MSMISDGRTTHAIQMDIEIYIDTYIAAIDTISFDSKSLIVVIRNLATEI